MKPLEGVDSKALRRPATILIAVALLSASLWWLSDRYKTTHVVALQQARSSLGAAREDYRLAVEANGILKTSQQRYQNLHQRGFLGDEPRLLWVESLRSSGLEHNLYNLQYSLRQRQPVQLNGMEIPEHYQLYASHMQLQLELAHEVDLLRYFSGLDARRPAVYQLRSCALKPLLNDNEIALDKANVKASCELLWYTAKNLGSIDPQEELF